jgi:uncharacterized membrane protein YqjE
MPIQTPTNGHRTQEPPAGVAENITSLGNDVLSLAELQARLLACEMRDLSERASAPVTRALIATLVGVTVMPMLWLGSAELVAELTGWPRGAVQLGLALSAIAVAGGVVWSAWKSLRETRLGFRRSREELARNWHWLKTVVAHSGRGR